jgi:hypothetical protein
MADEELATPVAKKPVAAPAAPEPQSTIDELIDKWFGVEFAGTVFADTPEKCNQLRVKIDNLKQILKIKE